MSYDNVLRWMSEDPTDQSTLVQVMAWCRQATSHYLSQCWPRSMSPNGITRPQWVKMTDEVSWNLVALRVIAHCGLEMSYSMWVNIGSGNGLAPDDTRPLPEPFLTNHRWGFAAFIWWQFQRKCFRSMKCIWEMHQQLHLSRPISWYYFLLFQIPTQWSRRWLELWSVASLRPSFLTRSLTLEAPRTPHSMCTSTISRHHSPYMWVMHNDDLFFQCPWVYKLLTMQHSTLPSIFQNNVATCR